MNSGRISIFVSSELQTLLQATKELPAEVNKQIRKYTRQNIEPMWQEAVRGHVQTRLQTRVLADTARVSVSDQQVTLKSAGIGKLSSGTPIPVLGFAVEFGADPNKMLPAHSSKGKVYKRRAGHRFGLPRSRGYVVYPAAGSVIPRAAALWVQTAVRTIHEAFEAGGDRGN